MVGPEKNHHGKGQALSQQTLRAPWNGYTINNGQMSSQSRAWYCEHYETILWWCIDGWRRTIFFIWLDNIWKSRAGYFDPNRDENFRPETSESGLEILQVGLKLPFVLIPPSIMPSEHEHLYSSTRYYSWIHIFLETHSWGMIFVPQTGISRVSTRVGGLQGWWLQFIKVLYIQTG